jgi:hypothetical protein
VKYLQAIFRQVAKFSKQANVFLADCVPHPA